MPLRETLEELRWRREDVGWVALGCGSAGSRTLEVALEAIDVVEATDAD
jgi:hypothetical protein